MKKRIIMNPVTRISGFMEVDVLIENHVVVEAKTKGSFFRGFEQMLVGRSPFDSIYFTQRICGICSAAHSMAASLALEDALNILPTEQGRYLRDIIHCCEFLQNHLRHFYQYTIPDYVKLPNISPLEANENIDFRLPKKINNRISKHYFESLELSRLAHQMLAVLGGKAPHNHGVFVGGITTQATTDKIIKMKSILNKISDFIEQKTLPDAYSIAEYYQDYFQMGGGYRNLLSYGSFNNYRELGTLYVDALIYQNGKLDKFDPNFLTETIDYAWYEGKDTYKPEEDISKPNMDKEKAYSWVKAPRYNGLPYEVGPLARLWLNGEYQNGISAMDRDLARVLEAKKIAEVMGVLLDQVIPGTSVQEKYSIPENEQGRGLVDTTRGALGHWVKIENKTISFYQVITPSAWDFSTRDEHYLGTAEQALIGTAIQDPDNPVELGRILRSFDPCMSCATHVYRPGKEPKTIKVM
ncbi:nickel-dependent hydrogenase large subunit [Bacillus taeanensis]|uniref:Ni/Fe hydrogenase n=1 Tax=Bacillus taeanensis TaxID=273032 RepID=A0A366Y1W2_9BACI|nr:nickel-dependent hydrogenase large subunit [Bacillus taeanensis]RBW70969.1 Ni/Fe hydrogenase [Bacillus taeanensis]